MKGEEGKKTKEEKQTTTKKRRIEFPRSELQQSASSAYQCLGAVCDPRVAYVG